LTDATIAASFGLCAPAGNAPTRRRSGRPAWTMSRGAGWRAAGTRIGATPAERSVHSLGDHQASFLGSVRDVETRRKLNIGHRRTGLGVRPRAGRAARHRWRRVPFPGGGFHADRGVALRRKAYALLEEFFRRVCESWGGEAGAPLFERMNRLAGEGGEKRRWRSTPLPGHAGDPRSRADRGITPGT